MYKFKFDPPQEHRRSLQQHKSEHITIVNTLDKCTQILREDRLWLRNEIKNNNPDVLAIFKQHPRSVQLQHLQIKLRKYVQSVKNKIKQQQLNKFRQTLHTQPSQEQKQSIPTASHSKRHQNPSKSQLKSTFSQLNKTTTFKPNKSQQMLHIPTQPKLTSSFQHFQDLVRFKYHHDVIEERQSQNVTSARLGRQQNESTQGQKKEAHKIQQQKHLQQQSQPRLQQFNRPLQELTSNHNQYQPYSSSQHKENSSSQFIGSRPSFTKSIHQSQPWQFQKQAKKALYQYQAPASHQEEIEDINIGFASRFNNNQYSEPEQSIFDKHFNQSDKNSKQPPESEDSHEIQDFGFNHQQYGTLSRQSDHRVVQSPVFFQHKNQSETLIDMQEHTEKYNKIAEQLENHQKSHFSDHEQQTEVKKEFVNLTPSADPSPGLSSRNDESLFTPQDLLNECRNFLKNRENSMIKSDIKENDENFSYQEAKQSFSKREQQKEQTLKEELFEHESQNLFNKTLSKGDNQCLFSRDNSKQPTFAINNQTIKEEESNSSYPELRSMEEQFATTSQKVKEDYHFAHFDTFANSSNKKVIEKSIVSPQHLHLSSLSNFKPKETVEKLPTNFSIEDWIEYLMEMTQMNPFITVQSLKKHLSTYPDSKALTKALSEQLNQSSDHEICLTTLGQKINKTYNEQHQQPYPHGDSTINSVYDLLDMDQKGYISHEDIDSFLNQIEQAQVHNFQQISQQLIRLFDGADFTNEQKLTYWHFYLVKSSEQFQRVSQLLSEFQFQIERQE